MQITIPKIQQIYVAALIASFFPMSLAAETTEIKNIVSAHSSSGGNVVSEGEVVTGKAKNSISVQTVVNGQVVENFSSTSDKPVSYERTTTLQTGTVTSKVNASTTVEAVVKTTIAKAIATESEAQADTHVSAASSTISASTTADAPSQSSVSFISNLFTKLFSYVTLWLSFR